MATIKFTEESPYQLQKRNVHHTDYKYAKFLKNMSSVSNGTHNGTDKPHHMNIALFGLGRAGTIHLDNIFANPRLRLAYLVEEDQDKANAALQNYGLDTTIVLPPSEQDNVFNDSKVYGIVVATPTFTHEAIVTKALTAGKHVMCEKPVSLCNDETRRCYNLAKKMGKGLVCAFNRRFDPAIREIHEQVKAGKVGRVHLVRTTARDSPLPTLDYIKISGGIFHDCGVHDIDMICWILGEYPDKVFAAATSFIPEIKDIGDHDTVAITLSFPSGALGMVDLSRNAVYGYDQRLEVFGPKGMVATSNESPIQVSFSGLGQQSQPPICQSFPSCYDQSYKEVLNHFCDVMQEKTSSVISGENTLKISKIANALETSVKLGQFISVNYE